MNTKQLLALNKHFKLPVHPFNLQNEGKQSYAMWQYERGGDTIAFYRERYSTDEMFCGKIVLDIGCGAGGKTMYYASLGAQRIVGMDILEQYREEAQSLARELGFDDRFEFVCGDAAHTDFSDGTFDTVIMNDAMEHVDRPDLVLAEVRRILKTGGRLYVNFPPINHPFGAHLSDLIGIPWVHLFFNEDIQAALPNSSRRRGARCFPHFEKRAGKGVLFLHQPYEHQAFSYPARRGRYEADLLP